MNGRERLTNILEGKEVDRIAVAPFIFNNFVCEFFGDFENESIIEKTIKVYEHFGFDIIHRNCNVNYFDESLCDNDKWSVRKTKEYKDNKSTWVVTTKINTPEKQLVQKKQYEQITEFEVIEAVKEYFIKEKSDFEQFLKYQPAVPKYDCSIIKKCRKKLGNKGLVAPWAQGIFNMTSFYRKIDKLLLDPYLDFEFYKNMIEYFGGRMLKIIKQFVESGADIICAGGNVATASMVGPDYFKKYVLPFEKEFAKKVKEQGVYYLYHNCGDAKDLLSLYPKIDMNIYESLTPPPFGDTILKEAVNKIDNSIVLSGNIDQIKFLRESSPKIVKDKVKDVLNIAKKRKRFILGTSDYLCENTPYENLHALSEAAIKYGKY